MKRSRTADQLVMPILSAGRHRNPRQGACFMEYASYLAGERWSDHPACTHPVLAALARDVNDLSSYQARTALTPLIHRVVGLTTNDPRLMATLAMRSAAAALPIASLDRQRGLAVAMLNVLATHDEPRLRELADHSFAQAPGTREWAQRFLSSTPTPHGFGLHPALATVHTAAVGIALACVPDQDAQLRALLDDAIGDAEAFLMSPAVPVTPRSRAGATA